MVESGARATGCRGAAKYHGLREVGAGIVLLGSMALASSAPRSEESARTVATERAEAVSSRVLMGLGMLVSRDAWEWRGTR